MIDTEVYLDHRDNRPTLASLHWGPVREILWMFTLFGMPVRLRLILGGLTDEVKSE